jgi:diguanylate cyclase (GGDEF)-like protein
VATAVGSWYDNGLEAMTVALGMVTAVLLVHSPPVLIVMVVIGVLGNRLTEIRQLQVDARTDSKTGLLNMRGWRELAGKELARADRSRAMIGLLMVDLDHFKLINDTWGHPAGDDMLLAVANVLRTETRPTDVVGRFGGEEFVVLLPDTDRAASLAAAERIRLRVAALTVITTDKRGGPAVISGRTTSIGVAVRPDVASTLPDLLQAADGAVYEAKESGRDRVRLAGADGADPGSSAGIAS